MHLWKRNEKLASRKFIDLIWRTSSKWAVWDPPSNGINLGDYGRLNKDTGAFERRGNIYTNPEFADFLGSPDPQGELIDNTDEVICIASRNAKSVSVEAEAAADVQVAQAAFQAGWKFKDSSGAVLVAHKPRQHCLPQDIDLERLTKELNGQYLVTSVTVCPAYALYLATKDDSDISFALRVEAPVPAAPVVTGPNVKAKWYNRHGAGLYREGIKEKEVFTVLYDLRICRRKGWLRDSPQPGDGSPESRLHQAYPPWTMLDDEGVEQAHIDSNSFKAPCDDDDDDWS